MPDSSVVQEPGLHAPAMIFHCPTRQRWPENDFLSDGRLKPKKGRAQRVSSSTLRVRRIGLHPPRQNNSVPYKDIAPAPARLRGVCSPLDPISVQRLSVHPPIQAQK